MKNKLLRYSLLLLLMLVGGVSSLWAVESTGTIKFGSAQGSIQIKSTSVTGADDLGNTWTITTEGTSSFTSSSLYYQVGSSSKPATSITFTMTLPQAEKVTSFSAKFGGFSGTAGDVSLKVGNTEVGSGALNATDDVTISSNESAKGSVLTVTITNIAKGVKCYYISYTYGEADTRTATKITLGDYETTGKVGGSISIPKAIVSDNAGTPINGTTVTWSSSDETVVSIDNTENKFKLLKPGISTIKAKYEGDATYQPCTTSFDLSVNADATFDFTSQSNWNIPSSGTNKDEKEFTDGTYTIKLYSTENYKLMDGYLIIGKANSYLEFPAFDFAVKKIEVVGHAGASSSVIQNIYVGETAVSTATTGANDVTNIYEIANNYQAAGNIYKLVITSSHNTQIEKIYVYKADTEEQPKQLFVIGDIATNGWDMTKMDELTYNSTTKTFEMECVTKGTANFAFSKYQYETVNWDNFNDNDRLAIGDGNVAATLDTEYQLKEGNNAVNGDGPCVQIAAAGRYKISVTTDLKMTITQLEDTYVVAGAVGDEAESGKDDILFGKTWDVTANELTADATGILSKTFENIELTAGTVINYKIVKNGNTWIPDGMDNNLTCDIHEAGKYNITVTFDPTALTPYMTAEKTGDVTPTYTSFSALQSYAATLTEETPVKIAFNGEQVVFVSGSNAYMADADGYGMMIFQTNHGLKAGQKLTGTITAKLQMYQGSAEITSFSSEGLQITTADVVPTEKTISDIQDANQSTLVTLKDVTYNAKNKTFTDGTNTIAYYDKFKTNATLYDGKKYDVTGIVIRYQKNAESAAVLQICPRTADDLVTEMFYITGDFQGDWSTSDPAEMKYYSLANTYSYLIDVAATAPMHFTIATGKANDWETFNNNYRLGIGAGDQVVTLNTEYTLAKYSNGTMVISEAGTYLITVTEDMKMTITPVGIVTYQLQKDETFTSGQTVDVKIDEEVVATITYGETGGADFKAAKEDNHVSGYVAYTEGNGINGNKTGGTFYTIVPKYDGSIEVAVALNADKDFFILEDGTALKEYNGIKVSEKYYGTYKFNVKAGKSYKFYCAGSKLAFYGFNYVYDITTPVVEDTYVVAGAYGEEATSEPGFFGTAWDKDAAANKMEEQADGTFKKAYSEITIADNTTIYYKVVKNGETWMPDNNLSYKVKKGGKFNITVTYDPTAQQDAIKMTVETLAAGDANLDGEVTTSDAVATVSFALEKEVPTAEQFKAADFNKSNVITVTDAVAIVNVALEEDPTGAAPMFNAGDNFLTLNGTALSLTNSTAFVAFQMDVTLTNGAVLNGVLPTERTQGLTLSFNRVGENTWRIVAFSIEKNAITGNEGDLLTFDITGSKTMTITNIEFADTYAIAYALGFNDGETTGIRPINNGQLTIDNVIYDLNGRRVQNPSKGVYVINGKKVVIK